MAAVLCESCVCAGHGSALRGDDLLRPLLPALLPWLVTRRWFTHERGCLQELTPVAASTLAEEGSVLVHALVDARHSSADPRRYQLLLGLRRSLPAALAPSVIGRAVGGARDGWWLHEATEDPELMARLLQRTATGTGTRSLRLSLTGSRSVPAGLTPRALSVEQSNSTVVYGDRLLLKFFRQPETGPHPETEALRALTRVHCTRTPELVGWLHTDGPAEEPTVLGILEEFLPAEGSGWDLAVGQAADCLGGACRSVPAIGGFTEAARELGEAVADLHTSLGEAFPRVHLAPHLVLEQTADMERRLMAAVAAVPELERYADRIGGLYDDYARVALRGRGLTGQRIHGDLHLGQVLRTASGWKIIDFEGEPARPVAERGLPQSPLRDVAGMLRSFDYAAQQALVQVLGEGGSGPESAPARLRQTRRAYAWAVRNRRAFTAGYAAAGGSDPHCHPVALRAFEADKAVYEAAYEAAHRPEWLPIPMAAIQRLVFGR